jgi:hypothetical protein
MVSILIDVKGHGRLKGDHNRIYQLHFYLFTFLSLYFSDLMFCSSTTSVAWENVLAGLPSLGQPKVRLSRRGPSRAGGRSLVSRRWIRRPRSDRPSNAVWPPYAEVRQKAPLRACWLRKDVKQFGRRGSRSMNQDFIPYKFCNHLSQFRLPSHFSHAYK